MVIDEKEIAEYLLNRRTFTSWNSISEITDDETHIYIKLSPYEAYIINKSSIVGATPIEFIEKAKSYFNQFKSNKEESEGHKI